MVSVSVSKAKSLIREMRSVGMIQRYMNFEPTGLLLDKDFKVNQLNFAKYGLRGYIIRGAGGQICRQVANSYKNLISNAVKYVR